MDDRERRSLRRAALILLAVSAVRWVVTGSPGPGPDESPPAGPGLSAHVEAVDAAVADAERRSRPLADGETIDPNTASPAELDRLPGIGPATAEAVVAARDSGQTFTRTEDLLVVRGIGPATVEKIRGHLRLQPGAGPPRPDRTSGARRAPATAPGASRPVDVNRAGAEELERLPGIGPALAARIVEERRHRPFSSVEELRRVRGIGPATVARLRTLAVVRADR